MGSYNEQYLKPCPKCGGKIKDDSYDRRIRFLCKPCGYTKWYPGLIQDKVSTVPIPYSDGKGGVLELHLVKHQEYYHYPERFRYEVESHTRYNGDYEFGYGFYPKGQFRYSYHAKAIVLFSSLYSPVAKFKLKQWK